jgi:hypothetical protein
MATQEIVIRANLQDALDECSRRGLVTRSERELGGKPGSHHYHMAIPGKTGTLELSELDGKVWFSVSERRDTEWLLAFAREVADWLASK